MEKQQENQLTGALEDYLETIYELVRENKVARVKDIARARGVRAASVTPAMRRLSEAGMIRYVQREFIDLTPDGEQTARRIFARHQLLTRFFEEILRMSPDLAEGDACAMEHSLSSAGMEHLVRLFEFMRNCPEGQQLLARFHRCSLVHGDVPECQERCATREGQRARRAVTQRSLADLAPGERARVAQVNGSETERRHLLDMGLLPDVVVEIARVDRAQRQIWIALQGFELALGDDEATCVAVGRGVDEVAR